MSCYRNNCIISEGNQFFNSFSYGFESLEMLILYDTAFSMKIEYKYQLLFFSSDVFKYAMFIGGLYYVIS